MRRDGACDYLKMDTRFLSKSFITDFIKLYETFPCLWKTKSEQYTNKSLKNEAYKQLILFCKKTYPEADLKFVKHKIQSMRNSFRKELRKVNASKRARTDNVYEPSLSYYKLLLFTKDQDIPKENVENVEHAPGKAISQDLEKCFQTVEDENVPPTVTSLSQESSNITKRTVRKRKYSIKENFLNTCISALRNENNLDEFDTVGKNIAVKLRHMEFHQRVLAELLIQQILTKGLFNEITRNTVLEEHTFTIQNAYSLSTRPHVSTALESPVDINNDQETSSIRSADNKLS